MTVQPKLPKLDRGPQRRRIPEKESEVQECVRTGLRHMGYVVLSTSERRRGVSCPKCRQWFTPTGGTGADKGVPDLLVTHDRWRGRWLGLEIKGTTGRLSPEQRALYKRGLIWVVRSWEDALRAVREVETDA